MADVIRAHRIELVPDAETRVLFARAAGTARFAWNWALTEWQRLYKEERDLPKAERQPLNEAALRRRLNAIKHDDFPWMAEVTKERTPAGHQEPRNCVPAVLQGRVQVSEAQEERKEH